MTGADLHMLVHSLNKAERDRVVQNARRADRVNDHYYLDLFHDLLRETKYVQDKDFLNAHPEARYIKSFAKIKGYLRDEILDAQRSLRRRDGEGMPADSRIRELIEEAQILRNKQLYAAGYERLLEAKDLAREYQFQESLLEVLKLERTYLGEKGDPSLLPELQAVVEEIQVVGRAIHAACTTMTVRERLFQSLRFHTVAKEDWEPFLRRCDEELDQVGPGIWDSLEAQTNYHLARALIFRCRGQHVASWQEHRAVYHLWRDNPAFASARRAQHLKLLNNFISISLGAGMTEDFLDAVATLERNGSSSADEKAEAKQNSTYIRLQYFLSRAEWESALEIEREFNRKPDWATVKSQKPRLLAFYLCFARLHFVLGEFKEVRAAIRKFDSERNRQGNEELLLEVEVLRLLMLMEEKETGPITRRPNGPDIPNKIRSIKRLLKKLPKQPRYMATLLNGISRIDGKPLKEQAAEWPKVHSETRAEIENLNQDPAGQLFVAWLQSKSDGRQVSDILRDSFPTFSASISENAGQ